MRIKCIVAWALAVGLLQVGGGCSRERTVGATRGSAAGPGQRQVSSAPEWKEMAKILSRIRAPVFPAR